VCEVVVDRRQSLRDSFSGSSPAEQNKPIGTFRVTDEQYEALEGAIESIESRASDGDAEGVSSAAAEAAEAAVAGSYAVAETEAGAAAGELAGFRALGWDAHALASVGGPSTAFAHAITLSTYRARIQDAGCH